MTASPEQRSTASARRGYSKDFLAKLCTCGCPRVEHTNHTGLCACGCAAFSISDTQPQAQTSQALRTFNFGTVGPAAPAPAPAPEARGVAPPAPAPSTTPSPNGSPGLVAREGSASRCPFCLADDFETVPSLKCPNCKAWQHAACVSEVGRCAACNSAWPS